MVSSAPWPRPRHPGLSPKCHVPKNRSSLLFAVTVSIYSLFDTKIASVQRCRKLRGLLRLKIACSEFRKTLSCFNSTEYVNHRDQPSTSKNGIITFNQKKWHGTHKTIKLSTITCYNYN
jgi:hypothetical protein